MTPEEIVAELNEKNRALLAGMHDLSLSPDQMLTLLDTAAMEGFRLGSNVALSMVKGSLLVQLNRIQATRAGRSGR